MCLDCPETSLPPYSYIYLPYEDKSCSEIEWERRFGEIYNKKASSGNVGSKAIFRSADRLKLLQQIISSKSKGGCGLDLQTLLDNGCLEGAYPLHDSLALTEIELHWFKLSQAPWKLRIDDIMDYFGEKIGLQMAWLCHYTTWLLWVCKMPTTSFMQHLFFYIGWNNWSSFVDRSRCNR